ncbi:MFS general substrate transporter [Hysterangium stoloniferum]|nr:MFS general substrate transporter [Hysterangium stoloniferum]
MHSAPIHYRLYRRRFLGVFGLVMLNVFAGMNWPWFGPIANAMTEDFGITVTDVNWLGNVLNLVYLPTSLIVPIAVARWGVQKTCFIGTLILVLASWIRYSGTIHDLKPSQSFPLLLVGQILVGVAQPIFQVLGPKYSEVWFDLKGRTTATMIIAIANPIGGAIGQLISPLVGTPRMSILILGVITSCSVPVSFLVSSAPPTPPTFAGSLPSPPLMETVRALVGRPRPAEQRLERRDRLDFLLLCMSFGVYVAGTNSFSLLTNEIFAPVGYSSDQAGIMGAVLLLAGILAAVITAPLFDRVLSFRLGLVIKCLVPFLAGAWLSLIWAVRPDNTIPLYVVLAVIGAISVTLLPVALELGCEVTRNAEGSSALLWFCGNLWCFVFVLVEGALRSPTPPHSMRNALIFNGAVIAGVTVFMAFFRGRQARRQDDVAAQEKEVDEELR